MEYGTTCWDPYRIYQLNSLERIQYRAAKFVKGKREDGNDTIKELKWETLENRRRKTRITSLYRAHLGQKAWVDITARLEKPTYYDRNDHDFKIKCRKQKTDVGDNAGEMSPGSTTESYPAFARIGLRETPEKPQPGNLPRPGFEPGPPGFAARRADRYSTGVDLTSLPSKETFRGHSDSSFRGEGYIQCCVGIRLCDMYSNQELAEILFMYGKADGNAALARLGSCSQVNETSM
ncbi:hypothetical protein ANN_11707 [Periplaneta americana]|uniref:Uncharacterized protein n=1 Tax=Periplaneta americana TaxID=6978 RepID=A0ABQ8T6H1_PERAM|nr:hypothetical protein ANN_11707 [Periplaneta americana]